MKTKIQIAAIAILFCLALTGCGTGEHEIKQPAAIKAEPKQPTTLMCPHCGKPVVDLLDHFRPTGNIYMYHGSWTADLDWNCPQKAPVIYRDCDERVNTNYVYDTAWSEGTNVLGVYQDMVAVYHKEDAFRYAGVAMYSACVGYEGEYLKDIPVNDFVDIFINKTRPEYGSPK